MKKDSNILSQKKPVNPRKSRLSGQSTLSLSTQEKKEAKSFLQVTSVPITERLNPKENRFILLIQPQGVRATGGQYTAQEAHQIAKFTKSWDWSLNDTGKPGCLPALEVLLDQLCKSEAWRNA